MLGKHQCYHYTSGAKWKREGERRDRTSKERTKRETETERKREKEREKKNQKKIKCLDRGSITGPLDLQSSALPTELSRQHGSIKGKQKFQLNFLGERDRERERERERGKEGETERERERERKNNKNNNKKK